MHEGVEMKQTKYVFLAVLALLMIAGSASAEQQTNSTINSTNFTLNLPQAFDGSYAGAALGFARLYGLPENVNVAIESQEQAISLGRQFNSTSFRILCETEYLYAVHFLSHLR